MCKLSMELIHLLIHALRERVRVTTTMHPIYQNFWRLLICEGMVWHLLNLICGPYLLF